MHLCRTLMHSVKHIIERWGLSYSGNLLSKTLLIWLHILAGAPLSSRLTGNFDKLSENRWILIRQLMTVPSQSNTSAAAGVGQSDLLKRLVPILQPLHKGDRLRQPCCNFLMPSGNSESRFCLNLGSQRLCVKATYNTLTLCVNTQRSKSTSCALQYWSACQWEACGQPGVLACHSMKFSDHELCCHYTFRKGRYCTLWYGLLYRHNMMRHA